MNLCLPASVGVIRTESESGHGPEYKTIGSENIARTMFLVRSNLALILARGYGVGWPSTYGPKPEQVPYSRPWAMFARLSSIPSPLASTNAPAVLPRVVPAVVPAVIPDVVMLVVPAVVHDVD